MTLAYEEQILKMMTMTESGNHRLTPTQEKILSVLHRMDRRMTGHEISDDLWQHHGPIGISTIKGALSDLTRNGYLTNRQDVRPKGYGLSQWEQPSQQRSE